MTEPFTYEANFLLPNEIADLEAACESLPWYRQKIRGHYVLRSSCLFTKVQTSRSLLTHPDGKGMYLLDELPEAAKAYRAKLSAHAGVDINYMSFNRYADGGEYMGPHQHREDWGREDQRVWDLSLGTARPIVFEPKDGGSDDDRKTIIAQPGSLITMSTACNTTHLHSVPKDNSVKTVRYSINCKTIPPQVWCCRQGKSYPTDAVYVGRETSDRRGNLLREATPFGNHCHLQPARYREMLLAMIAADPQFAAQFEALRGKDLLCWCSGNEKEHCHARVLLELANAPPIRQPYHKENTGAWIRTCTPDTEGRPLASSALSLKPNQSVSAANAKKSRPPKKARAASQPYEHITLFLTKEEADQFYDTLMKQDCWIDNGDGSATLNFGYTYSRGGPAKGEIPDIPDFLRKLADRISHYTKHPVNYVQVHRFEPEHPVLPHYDPRGMCVSMTTLGQERSFQVGDDGTSKKPTGRQKNRKVEDHSPESRLLMRHGDLLVFTGNKVLHSMVPASKDQQFNPNGYAYRISILFRYTTEAMREFGVGVCNRHGHEKQYRKAVKEFQARLARKDKDDGAA